MIFQNQYWSLRTRLDLLARWLIVHSIIYYEIGTSILDDHQWDVNAKQFVWMARSDPIKASEIRWAYVMDGFDGTTGFHLWSRLNKVDQARLLNEAKRLVVEYGDAGMVLDKRKIKKPRRQTNGKAKPE